MKRIKLKYGSARVKDDCPDETIKALNELSEKAYQYSLSELSVDELIETRAKVRKEKDFKTADLIRDYLDSKYVFVFDTPDGQEVLYLYPFYFNKKPQGTTNREYLKQRQRDEIRAEKDFDSWLYSVRKSIEDEERKLNTSKCEGNSKN